MWPYRGRNERDSSKRPNPKKESIGSNEINHANHIVDRLIYCYRRSLHLLAKSIMHIAIHVERMLCVWSPDGAGVGGGWVGGGGAHTLQRLFFPGGRGINNSNQEFWSYMAIT